MANNKQHYLYGRGGLIATGVVALIAGWFMFIRAVDTGSLQQYGLLIVLVVFGINRLVRAVFPKKQ